MLLPLVLLVDPLPVRYLIEFNGRLTRNKPLELFFSETAIGDFSGGYFMNKANIGSYICGLKQ